MPSLALVIPAAGSGKRLGSKVPKPFIELCGKPILHYTLRTFAQVDGLKEVVIATAPEFRGMAQTIMQEALPEEVISRWVAGGKERQFSIYNALKEVGDVDLVAVHDAVRPFVAPAIIQQCITEADEAGGAIVAVPAKDTIKRTGADLEIVETPDRSRLWQSQTPQIFRKKLLVEAYEEAIKKEFVGTDDASLVEPLGATIKLVEGNRTNFKITYPFDLEVAELLIRKKEQT